MMKENSVEFKLTGRNALFTDPIVRLGGEKCTYMFPTYEALKGALSSIYWKPTITWVIDKVRIMNPVRMETKGIRPIVMGGGNTLSLYTYLSDVEYQVKAHFEWNENRPDLAHDRNENKHFFMAKRFIERGGRRDIFLGARECQAYAEPCVFGEGESYYQGKELAAGVMFHGFTYPDEAKGDKSGKLTARFWIPKMEDGEITFIRPEECPIQREILEMHAKEFSEAKGNFSGLAEFGGEFDGLVE